MGHHFVPRQYLRNFEDPNNPGFIWLHDKRGGVPSSVPIAKVAQSKHYYQKETETILASIVETPANAVIKKLTTDTAITSAERLQLAFYVGVMIKRIPARRRRSTEMIPGVLEGVVANIRKQLTSLSMAVQADPGLLAQRLREVDAAAKKLAIQPPPEVMNQILEPWPSTRIIQALFGMTWRILVSSGPQYFITSDNPAFFFNAYGLGNKESELSFPLSTTHTLHGSWQKTVSDLVFIRPTQNTVKEINRRLASETERLAFYHEPAPWLIKILAKKNPYLSRINWQ